MQGPTIWSREHKPPKPFFFCFLVRIDDGDSKKRFVGHPSGSRSTTQQCFAQISMARTNVAANSG